METMQDFYTRLVDEARPRDNYLKYLAHLTRLDLEQLLVLKSDLTWDPWWSSDQDDS